MPDNPLESNEVTKPLDLLQSWADSLEEEGELDRFLIDNYLYKQVVSYIVSADGSGTQIIPGASMQTRYFNYNISGINEIVAVGFIKDSQTHEILLHENDQEYGFTELFFTSDGDILGMAHGEMVYLSKVMKVDLEKQFSGS
jgi:hypothetical protein